MQQQHKDIFQFIFEHKITHDNFENYQDQLCSFFQDETECNAFIETYLSQIMTLSMDDFVSTGQRMDAFPVIRHQADGVLVQDFYELKYVMRGSALCIINDQSFLLEESDICIIKPYSQQQVYLFEEDCLVIILAIRRDTATDLLSRIMKLQNPVSNFFRKDFLSKSEAPYLIIRTDQDQEICEMVQDIFDGYHTCPSERTIDQLIQEARLEYILLKCIARHNELTESSEQHMMLHADIPEMLFYIQKNLKTVSLSELSGQFGYSGAYTSKLIHRATGQTFSRILQSLRLETAARLLEDTEWSIERIIQETGYSGRANFYDIFQKKYGMTPWEYRKKRGELQ